MTTTVTTHSSSVRVARIGPLTTLATSMDSSGGPTKSPASLPSAPASVTAMSGLLSSRHLVQDEKLVVATLATLDSGNASNLIKQDLRWIIQSRRKAEGKAELQVEFKKPVKDEQLTCEELIKRARRRELNRLAARRSREKGQKRKDMLVEEIRKLQSENSELVNILGQLTDQRNSIVQTLRQHMKQCSDYRATQSVAGGLSQRVLDLLGFPVTAQAEGQVVSDLYIAAEESSAALSRPQSPSAVIKREAFGISSCPGSPLVLGISSQLVQVSDSNIFYGGCSPTVETSPFNLISPQVKSELSYTGPLTSVHFESPTSARPRLPPRQCSTQSSDISTDTLSSASEAAEEEVVIHYKHKLMKHRKQFSELTESCSSTGRGLRVSLERSFSFPCAGRESRPSHDSVLPGLTSSQPHTPTEPYLESGNQLDGANCPVDLAVRRIEKSQEVPCRMRPANNWQPAVIRSGASFRNLERRWSVDDHQSVGEPLNLSSKDMSAEEGLCPAVRTRSASSYSSVPADPYR